MRSYLLLAAIAGLGASLNWSGCSSEKAAARSGQSSALPVEVQLVTPRMLENRIETTGTLLADEEIELRSEISGRITGLHFQEGRTVRKGELLIKMNDRDLRAQLTRKELEEKLAMDEERRADRLRAVDGISQEEYDRVLNKLQLLQAEKEELLADIAKTEIMAPFDGVIGLRSVSQGGYVTPSMLVATLQDIDPVKVEFSIPEKYAGLLKVSTSISARVGESGQPAIGTVFAVESKIDRATRTIRARASIPNPDRSLIPGSFARIEITLQQLPDAVVIPSQAIVPQLDGDRVYLVREGKAAFVPVVTGIRTEREIQIVSGVAANDSLIVTGLLQLTDGRAVSPQSSGSTP